VRTTRDKVMDGARWVAVSSGVALCGWLEWHAATATGIHPYVAVCLPVLIHVYVLTTILAGKDIKAALSVMWLSVAVGVTVVSLGLASGTAPVWVRAGVAMWMASVVAVVLYRLDVAVRESIGIATVTDTSEARDHPPIPAAPDATTKTSSATTEAQKQPAKPRTDGVNRVWVKAVAKAIRDGEDPSVRSLMRAYRIGEPKAKELKSEAVEEAAQSTVIAFAGGAR
jgi:hypothetical protein